MNNQTIKHILMDKGVQYLYHANTVPTACTFLEHGGLLSRAYIENHSLFQTSQKQMIKIELWVFSTIFSLIQLIFISVVTSLINMVPFPLFIPSI